MKNIEVVRTARLAILDEVGRMLLCRRSTEAKQRAGLWELPGGKIDDGETIVEGSIREIWEETGIALDEGLVVREPLYNIYEYDKTVNKWFSRDFLLYGGRIAADQQIQLTEATAYLKMPVEEALQIFIDIPHQRAARRLLPTLVA